MGKSCLVHRFVSDSFNASSPPTIGLVSVELLRLLFTYSVIEAFLIN